MTSNIILHPEILKKILLDIDNVSYLAKMCTVSKLFSEWILVMPMVQNYKNPRILGIKEFAHIGTDKIIFTFEIDQSSPYNYIILSYDKPFTFTHTHKFLNDLKYSQHKWYGKFTFSYRKRKNYKNIIKLYSNANNKKKIITNLHDVDTAKKFNNCLISNDGATEIHLSNGDILFNNDNSRSFCLLLTKNNPKINYYKIINFESDESSVSDYECESTNSDSAQSVPCDSKWNDVNYVNNFITNKENVCKQVNISNIIDDNIIMDNN